VKFYYKLFRLERLSLSLSLRLSLKLQKLVELSLEPIDIMIIMLSIGSKAPSLSLASLGSKS
jgi:hypothetical protein